MRSLILTAALVVLSSATAIAQSGAPFCVVSGSGRNCYYYSLSSCERAARIVDGACVANGTQTVSPQASEPPPVATVDGGRPYADFAGRFQQGLERSRAQRGVVTSDGPHPSLTPPTPVAPVAADEGMFPRPLPGWYDETRLNTCEAYRIAANRIADLADSTWVAIAPAFETWRTCLGPSAIE